MNTHIGRFRKTLGHIDARFVGKGNDCPDTWRSHQAAANLVLAYFCEDHPVKFRNLGHKNGANPEEGTGERVEPGPVFEELNHAPLESKACGLADL